MRIPLARHMNVVKALLHKCSMKLTVGISMGALLLIICLAGFLPLLPVAIPPCSASGVNEQARDPAMDLTELSLEELMNIEVTSVSKKEQKLSEAAAAIFVITQEDIRRSGATCIPEALRMVPGLEVARLDSNKWAVSARGFSGRFADKLLVLMDGRTVYTPFFSGVYWDVQDTVLEDIERIEVIRGPGATLWGANAVNGVINIITKAAKDTVGGLMATAGGSEEQGFGTIRYGSKVGNDTYVRAYTKYFNRDNFVIPGTLDAADRWHAIRGGFRLDYRNLKTDSFTIQGDVYDGTSGDVVPIQSLSVPYTTYTKDKTDVTGGNILARWRRILSDSSNLELRLYYDRTERRNMYLGEIRDTYDLDFQHCFLLGKKQELIWGLDYRFTHDSQKNSSLIALNPRSRSLQLLSSFIQDTLTLIRDRLHFVLGTKIERNDFTGFEFQPNARVIWTPHQAHTLWGSISRAVRTPSRSEDDGIASAGVIPPRSRQNPLNIPILATYIGDDDFSSETLIAYEVGYRGQVASRLAVDAAAFYNVYRNLRTVEPGSPVFDPSPVLHMVVQSHPDNKAHGESYGIEIASEWSFKDWWRFKTAYTYFRLFKHRESESNDPTVADDEGGSPRHQISLRSATDLGSKVEFDLWFRYVDHLASQNIDSYLSLDARLAWKPLSNLELSIVGQNLLDNHSSEWNADLFTVSYPSEVQRSVYGKITWRF